MFKNKYKSMKSTSHRCHIFELNFLLLRLVLDGVSTNICFGRFQLTKSVETIVHENLAVLIEKSLRSKGLRILPRTFIHVHAV